MVKVVFFGTPWFAAQTLAFLLDAGIEVMAVVSQPDRPRGRHGTPQPSEVKQLLLDRGLAIPLLQPEKASAPEVVQALAQYQADLFIVVAYGEILKQTVLDLPRLGCINVHASLLPKYRGAAPIQRAVMNGEKETGVSIMWMVQKMDAGDVLLQAATAIDPEETAGELQERLCILGQKALLEVLGRLMAGNLAALAQDEAQMTLAPKLELEDGLIDWTRPAQKIHDQIRGVTPRPGAWCWATVRGEKKRLKVFKSLVVDFEGGVPGALVLQERYPLCIACGRGALCLEEVQLEGKTRTNSKNFMSGFAPQELYKNFILFTNS